MSRAWGEAAPRLIVRAASLLVPRDARSDWAAEWCSELWHLSHACRREAATLPAASAIPISFGALADAFWMRWRHLCDWAPATFRAGSAARCLLFLAAVAGVGVLVCLGASGARNVLSPLPYDHADNLVMITGNGSPGMQAPSIRFSEYREWTGNTAALYSQIAWYRPISAQLHLTHHETAGLSIAFSSGNLLRLLGVEPADDPASSRAPASARLYLSREAWRKDYRSDPRIFGRMAEVGGQSVVIAGVMRGSAWRLPGRADAWLLEDAHDLAGLPPSAKGFVVARIRDSAFPPARSGWRSMVETRNDVVLYYACVSLGGMVTEPLLAFACCVLLALLALPAITALSLGDYPLAREPLRSRLVVRRWLFLAVKFAFVLAIVGSWSTAIAFGLLVRDLSAAAGVQALMSFVPLLFGFRWVLDDQRRRCPVCLRRLSNPARVGQASCNFLSWCGTELICASGHGLLHIPELPTSWFGTQRWLCLDPSWLCLFAEPSGGSPEPV